MENQPSTGTNQPQTNSGIPPQSQPPQAPQGQGQQPVPIVPPATTPPPPIQEPQYQMPGQQLVGQQIAGGGKKPKLLMLVMVMLTLVTLAAAGYGGFYLGGLGLFGENSSQVPVPTENNSEDDIPTTAPTSVPEPTEIPAPTVKEFKSKIISFSYPDYLPKLTLIEENDFGVKAYESKFSIEESEGSGNITLSFVGPEPNPEDYLLKQWLGEEDRLIYDDNTNTEVDTLKISDQTTVLLSTYLGEAEFPSSLVLYFLTDDGIYSIGLQLEVEDNELADKYQEEFDVILSSIELL